MSMNQPASDGPVLVERSERERLVVHMAVTIGGTYEVVAEADGLQVTELQTPRYFEHCAAMPNSEAAGAQAKEAVLLSLYTMVKTLFKSTVAACVERGLLDAEAATVATEKGEAALTQLLPVGGVKA